MNTFIFETHTLPDSLTDYIESIFYHKGYIPQHSIERVVPTGHIFILFELDGIERNTYDNETLEPNGFFKNVWVSGMHKSHISISVHQDTEMLVVQLKPAGSYPILHFPTDELNNRVIDATEIISDEILELRTSIISNQLVTDMFIAVEKWLLKRIDFLKKPDIELINLLNRLKSEPELSCAEIIADYSKTQKHLIQQFKKFFGLTPKSFHRIYRFNEMLLKIQSKQSIEWSRIAYQCGYSDQSHFIKEFKLFSGFNPQEFITADHHLEQPNFFPVDKKG